MILLMTESNFYIPTTYGKIYACFKPSTTGILIVMVHGLAGTRNSVFFRDVPQLTKHATLRFDLAGHGRSDGVIIYGFSPLVDQLQQILSFELFQDYKDIILIGHSRGANLVLLAAKEKSRVIAVAPRYFVNKYPDESYLQGFDQARQGNTIEQEFCGKKYNISKQDVDEIDKLDYNIILKQKELQLVVFSGVDDIFTQGEQTELFKQWTNEVYKFNCGHFDFKIEDVKDKLLQAIQ